MIVRWTKKAFLSLQFITKYIAADNLEASTRAAQDIYESIERLVIFPNRGRPGRKQGTRELVLTPLPYIVVYRIHDSTTEILQIRHGAQHVN